MSIEIYDKAEVIKLNDKYVFMVKHGSKNSFTCPHQYIIDNNFKDKYIRRQSRDSSWRVIAMGKIQSSIGETNWNAPTCWIYGRVMFGDKKNIALYLAKKKAKTKLDFDQEQWKNIERIIEYSKTFIDLDNIPENKKTQNEIEYCGQVYKLADHRTDKSYAGIYYWQLDNL